MEAVLDTNILIANLPRGRPSNDLKLVLADARTERFTILVPELVIDEVVKKRREKAQRAEWALRQAQSDLAAVGASIEVSTVDVEKAVAEFREDLVKMLTGAKVRIQDLPAVGHEPVVQRALHGRKPFDEKGAGYRDALIWETVLATAATPDADVVFVSNNWRDFAEDNQGNQFAEDLLEDLRAIGAEDRVRLFPDLSAFKSEFVATETIATDSLEEGLNDEKSSVREQLKQALSERLRGHAFDLYDMRDRERDRDWEDRLWSPGHRILDVEVERAEVVETERMYGVGIVSAQMYEDDMLFEFEAEIDAQIEFELTVTEEGEPYFRDEPWHRERISQTRYEHVGARSSLVAKPPS